MRFGIYDGHQLCLGHLFLHKTSTIRVIFSGQPVAHLTLTLEVMNAERNCYTKLRHMKHVSCLSTNSHEGLLYFTQQA